MHRNLDRRVETLVRLVDPDQITNLLDLIDISMDSGTASWHLQADGTWVRHATGPDGPLTDIQSTLITRQRRRLGMGQ